MDRHSADDGDGDDEDGDGDEVGARGEALSPSRIPPKAEGDGDNDDEGDREEDGVLAGRSSSRPSPPNIAAVVDGVVVVISDPLPPLPRSSLKTLSLL